MQLDHIAINVENIEKASEWYTKNLGAKIEYIDETWAMLDVGGTKIALTVSRQHPPHFAFTLKSLDDFPAGEEIRYHRDGSAYLYIEDPDGNTIEYVYWPESSNE